MAGLQNVRVHTEAHRAAGDAPVEASILENGIETLGFGLLFDQGGAGNNHSVHIGVNLAALDYGGGGAQVLEAGVGASADKDPVDFDFLQGGVRLQVHIGQGAGGGFALGRFGKGVGVGNPVGDFGDHTGISSPSNKGFEVGGVNFDQAVESRAGVGGQVTPLGNGGVIFRAFRGELAALDIGKGGVVRGNHPGPGAGFDAHIADGHPPVHRERADGFAGVFDDVTDAAVDADAADDAEDDIFSHDAVGELSVDPDFHSLGLELAEGLGSEDVFDFGGADAEGETAQSAVGGGVAVAADDGFAGEGVAQIGADDMDDALVGTVAVVKGDAEVAGVFGQGVELAFGNFVGDGQGQVPSGGVVVHGADGEVGAADATASQAEAIEGLGSGNFVDEVEVNVKDGGLARLLVNHMGVPDFLEHGLWRHSGTALPVKFESIITLGERAGATGREKVNAPPVGGALRKARYCRDSAEPVKERPEWW